MAASRFLEILPLLKGEKGQLGVCAMGPVGDDDKLVWMRVWVWQQDGDKVAAAAGCAGEQVPGAHELARENRPPFARPEKEQWMVQTKLEEESADFNHEKPALVQAIALVERGGERNIVQWSQGVGLKAPGAHGAGHHPEP
jgi:hypothetical protein